ncbi:MAG: YXWGXW repeat-containing protein, partial [Vulcanimicrobiaceae bacterium]
MVRIINSRLVTFVGALAIAIALIGAPAPAPASVFIGVSVNFGPPALPVYEQPPCPAPNLIWTPGYWGYGPYGYFWVPGTWVAAPRYGYLWTPGYWGYGGNVYAWHPGYWGPHIGYYGCVNYGFGYFGAGYVGGGWFGDRFRYNTAVTNVNRTVINDVYVNRTVINNYDNTTINRVSYNGGPGGVVAQPTRSELAYENERHVAPTAAQTQHLQTAARDRNYLATVNHGSPANAAFTRPLSRQNRPANFPPVAATDRRASMTGSEGPSAFDRFNKQPGYHAPANQASTYGSNRAYRAN